MKLERSDLERNFAFLGDEKSNFYSFREFLLFLTPFIVREQLIFFKHHFSQEIETRTTILCESIPGIGILYLLSITTPIRIVFVFFRLKHSFSIEDVWTSIFRQLANNKDISEVFHLREVSKKWHNTFSQSLTEATILRENSIQGYLSILYRLILEFYSK